MIYSGVDQNMTPQRGIVLLVDFKWKNRLSNYTYVNEWIVLARFRTDRGNIRVIAVCAPNEGHKEDCALLPKALQKVDDSCNKSDHILLLGELNAWAKNQPINEIGETFSESHINDNWYQLRDSETFNELEITNTIFRKKRMCTNIYGVQEVYIQS